MAVAWYVAQTKPNAERQATRRLKAQAFAVYVPMLRNRTASRGTVREQSTPLFPGYVFVRLDLDDPEGHWKAVNSTRAVLTLLPTSERPAAVRAEDVEGLQQAEAQGVFRRGIVAPGERVKVFRGNLANQVLECVANEGERLRCLWYCLGAHRVVSVPAANVLVLP